MSRHLPEHIARISPYVTGGTGEESPSGMGSDGPVKVASNENPFGPSPKAVEAARKALEQSHRYPDGSGRLLREALAERFKLPADQIILGNGSTELVELLARTFLGSEGRAVMAEQTFVMYRIAVMAVNGHAREVPLRDMRHDLDAMAAACDERTVLAYIANPSNPTGTYVGVRELERFLRQVPDSLITVLDEAYSEYVDRPDYPSGLDFLRRGNRIVILRTFSKAYGLAGLRIGFGLAPADLVADMERVRSPFNTSRVAQAAALAALEDQEHIARSRSSNHEGRILMESELRRRGIPFVPSVANFVLVDVGQDAEATHQALFAEGVLSRPMGPYQFPTSLRVTVGTPVEIRRFFEALDRFLAGTGRGSS